MARDFSHRICIDRELIPFLKQQGQQLLFNDLAGVVNYILRAHLTNSISVSTLGYSVDAQIEQIQQQQPQPQPTDATIERIARLIENF